MCVRCGSVGCVVKGNVCGLVSVSVCYVLSLRLALDDCCLPFLCQARRPNVCCLSVNGVFYVSYDSVVPSLSGDFNVRVPNATGQTIREPDWAGEYRDAGLLSPCPDCLPFGPKPPGPKITAATCEGRVVCVWHLCGILS